MALSKTPRVGVGIIITKGNQVLLLRRHNAHGAGSWSTPGGHLDFGESPEACAIRSIIIALYTNFSAKPLPPVWFWMRWKNRPLSRKRPIRNGR
jgi:hypothetical protein